MALVLSRGWGVKEDVAFSASLLGGDGDKVILKLWGVSLDNLQATDASGFIRAWSAPADNSRYKHLGAEVYSWELCGLEMAFLYLAASNKIPSAEYIVNSRN